MANETVQTKKKFTETELWKFIKFSFAGASSSVVQILAELLFYKVIFKPLAGKTIESGVLSFLGIDSEMDAALAYFVAAAIGYAIAYIMNRKITFNSSGNVVRSVILYVIMVVATLFITAWISAELTALFKGWGNFAAADGSLKTVPKAIVSLITIIIPFVWTYPLQRFVINPPRKDKPAEETAEAKAE